MSSLRVLSPILLCALSITACVRVPVQPDEPPVPPPLAPAPATSSNNSEFIEPPGPPMAATEAVTEAKPSGGHSPAEFEPADTSGAPLPSPREPSGIHSGVEAAAGAPVSPIPSFGAGAELARRADDADAAAGGTTAPASSPSVAPTVPVEQAATAAEPLTPSFGAGAELYRANEGDAAAPPLRVRPPRLEGESLEPLPSAVPLSIPVPPPARSDALTLSAYQLQTEVYGLQTALQGRPLLPRMIVRIDAMALQSQSLPELAQGRPRHQQLAQEVRVELQKLQGAARLRDRETLDLSLVRLQDLLVRLRGA